MKTQEISAWKVATINFSQIRLDHNRAAYSYEVAETFYNMIQEADINIAALEDSLENEPSNIKRVRKEGSLEVTKEHRPALIENYKNLAPQLRNQTTEFCTRADAFAESCPPLLYEGTIGATVTNWKRDLKQSSKDYSERSSKL